MRILVSGASGLVGSALCSALTNKGYEVNRLHRKVSREDDKKLYWNPAEGTITDLPHFDAVVHLAGKNIASGRWTSRLKQEIRDSRVKGTQLLVSELKKQAPKTLIAASAVGYYGDCGSELLGEDAPQGSDFLAEVCGEWESAAEELAAYGTRVVRLRIGAVLSKDGGALKKMLPAFLACAGGRIGNGRQYMSWISLRDTVRVISHCLKDASIEGPVNTVAPTALTNSDFTKALGKALRRPTLIPLPAFAARLALGELADAILLSSIRTKPARLLNAGFEYKDADLETFLRSELG